MMFISMLVISYRWNCNVPFLSAGVDFKVKHVTLGGKKLKLAIWDTGKTATITCNFFKR